MGGADGHSAECRTSRSIYCLDVSRAISMAELTGSVVAHRPNTARGGDTCRHVSTCIDRGKLLRPVYLLVYEIHVVCTETILSIRVSGNLII